MTQDQVRPFFTTRSLDPENQESPIHFLNQQQTPANYFYRRNHFAYPGLTLSNYWLHIIGQVARPRFFHLNEILAMPAKSLVVPLECAGNKRAMFEPKVHGEQWEAGAMSQGKWMGVPLIYFLEKAGLLGNAKEIVFEGADFGEKPGSHGKIPFIRSLPLDKALHPDTLVAHHYNDKPLSFKHGFPLRLIVPNWYGMASVKWLFKIKVIDHFYEGPFQTEDYVYYPYKNNDKDKVPVTILNVNSTIQQPTDFSILDLGTHQINGIAWTGLGDITAVQVSFDKGEKWEVANLNTMSRSNLSTGNYGWVNWSFNWKAEKKGEYTIYSRATDSAGRVQPLTAFLNRKGYGYNAVSKINVKVE